jgi:hypothetical protein
MNARDTFRLAVLALFAGTAFAQGFDSMPEYRLQQQVSGIIRISGDYHEQTMLTNWEQDFHKYQPNVLFHNNLTSTVHGIPALVFNVADIGLLGREIAPLEDLSFRRMFKYEPFEIATAAGSFDTQYETFAIGVFVNKERTLSPGLRFHNSRPSSAADPGRASAPGVSLASPVNGRTSQSMSSGIPRETILQHSSNLKCCKPHRAAARRFPMGLAGTAT